MPSVGIARSIMAVASRQPLSGAGKYRLHGAQATLSRLVPLVFEHRMLCKVHATSTFKLDGKVEEALPP